MTDIQMEMNYDYSTAERFPAWISLAVFSAICMAAFCSEVDTQYRGSDEKWVLAVYCISMSVATLASVGYLLVRGIFAGTMIEISMVTLVTAFWGIGLPVIMKPDNAIAVVGADINNANLYFSSWIAFVVAIFLVLSLVREKFGLDVRDTPGKQLKWFFLSASSLVVMGSAIRIHKSESVECGNSDSPMSGSDFCKRTNFAISMGVITFFMGLTALFLIMRMMLVPLIELGVTTILLILWTFGVGFITFGGREKAPGTTVGNLYFGTWISFILCLALFGSSLKEFTAGSASQETPSASSPAPRDDSDTGGLPQEDDNI